VLILLVTAALVAAAGVWGVGDRSDGPETSLGTVVISSDLVEPGLLPEITTSTLADADRD